MSSQIHSMQQESNTSSNAVTANMTASAQKQTLASKILALSGVLQTTLELNELLALFSKEIRAFVEFNGLNYDFPGLQIDISLGDQSAHNCAYQLVVAGEPLGRIKFFRQTRFSEKELETIENLLSGLLYPLRNTLLYQQALQSAIMDPVTGVKNRSAMDNTLKRELELARRHKTPVSVLLLDIDHFKQINDRYGHLFGDQVLRMVAKSAEKTIRESDMIFRFGGEEFLILLTGTELAGAVLLAERVRESIQETRTSEQSKMRLTASLGAAQLNGEESLDELLTRTDRALYQAKEAGRNQVVTA